MRRIVDSDGAFTLEHLCSDLEGFPVDQVKAWLQVLLSACVATGDLDGRMVMRDIPGRPAALRARTCVDGTLEGLSSAVDRSGFLERNYGGDGGDAE